MTKHIPFSPRVRTLLVVLAAVAAPFFAGAVSPANAIAGTGFCEKVILKSGEQCETSGLYTVYEVVAELTGAKSGEICVGVVNEGQGYDVKCAEDYAATGEIDAYGHAWVYNDSNTQLTVTGYFNYL